MTTKFTASRRTLGAIALALTVSAAGTVETAGSATASPVTAASTGAASPVAEVPGRALAQPEQALDVLLGTHPTPGAITRDAGELVNRLEGLEPSGQTRTALQRFVNQLRKVIADVGPATKQGATTQAKNKLRNDLRALRSSATQLLKSLGLSSTNSSNS